MTDLRRRYLDHFTTAFGRPSGRRGFDSGAGQPPIEVLAFQGVVQDCQVFASLGFSSYLQQVRETAEVVVVVDSAGDRVPTILANVLFTLVHHPPGFGLGVAIRFPKVDPAFVAEFGKSALYFTYPILFPPEFALVEGDEEGQAAGHVYGGYFISEAEHAFLRAHGREAFERLLKEGKADPSDLRRPSLALQS
jgi:hypothetical protein